MSPAHLREVTPESVMSAEDRSHYLDSMRYLVGSPRQARVTLWSEHKPFLLLFVLQTLIIMALLWQNFRS